MYTIRIVPLGITLCRCRRDVYIIHISRRTSMDFYKVIYWIGFSNRNLPSFFTSISFIASRQEIYIINFKNSLKGKNTLKPKNKCSFSEDKRSEKGYSKWSNKFNISRNKSQSIVLKFLWRSSPKLSQVSLKLF